MRKDRREVIFSDHFNKRQQERFTSDGDFDELCDFGRITQIGPAPMRKQNDLPYEFQLCLQKGYEELVAIVATDGRKFVCETCIRRLV